MQDAASLRTIFNKTKSIAMVGASANPIRPSHFVMRYLLGQGFDVIPINPGLAGQSLLGQEVKVSLEEVSAQIDMVDVFRQSAFVPEIYDQMRQCHPEAKVFWMQIGVEHAETAQRAKIDGIEVVENKCTKMEHQKLYGHLRKFGVNTGVISSKLA